MGLFGKRKNNDKEPKEEKILSPEAEAINSTEELKDEMKIIMEAMDEEKADRQAKISALAQELAEQRAKELQAEEAAGKAAGRYLSDDESKAKGDFFLTVDEIPESLPATDGNLMVRGNLHGTVSKGDKITVFHGNNGITTTEVAEIKTVSNSENVFDATDVRVELELEPGNSVAESVSKDLRNTLGKYSVITNRPAQTVVSSQTKVENPRLLALSFEYQRFGKMPDFFNIFIHAMVHSTFLISAIEDKNGPNGKKRIGLMSVSDKDNSKVQRIAVFTDHKALFMGRNSTVLKPEEKIIVMSFQKLANFLKKSPQHDGIVINPFGPMSIRIPGSLIEEITKSEPYQAEFGDGNVKIEEIKKEAQVMIGGIAESEEFTAIKNAIKTYGSEHPEVERVGMVFKKLKDSDEPASYLCIVDCPKDKMEETYKGIYAGVKPFLNKVRKIEFMLFSESVFAEDLFAKTPLVYKK